MTDHILQDTELKLSYKVGDYRKLKMSSFEHLRYPDLGSRFSDQIRNSVGTYLGIFVCKVFDFIDFLLKLQGYGSGI